MASNILGDINKLRQQLQDITKLDIDGRMAIALNLLDIVKKIAMSNAESQLLFL